MEPEIFETSIRISVELPEKKLYRFFQISQNCLFKKKLKTVGLAEEILKREYFYYDHLTKKSHEQKYFCFKIESKFEKLYHIVLREIFELYQAITRKLSVKRKTSLNHFRSRDTVLYLLF